MRIIAIVILATCALTQSTPPAAAAVWYVPGDAPTISGGLALALSGDTVEVACGVYYEHSLLMPESVTLRSATGQADCVVIDAQSLGRCMAYAGNDPTLIEGITFRNGRAVAGLVPMQWGGGIYIDGTGLRVVNCAFLDNYAQSWGGGGGGAMGAEFDFANCWFEGNEPDGLAGDETGGSIVSCTFYANLGRAIDLMLPSATTIEQCTVAANTGHGIVYEGFNLTLRNTIVAFNGGTSLPVNPMGYVVECCDLYGNTGGDWVGWLAGLTATGGNFSADPCFCDLAAGDLTLCADSWCLAGHHPWGCDALVGAHDQGCSACSCAPPVAVESSTWGAVKSLYR